jgi:hypothetical protein
MTSESVMVAIVNLDCGVKNCSLSVLFALANIREVPIDEDGKSFTCKCEF